MSAERSEEVMRRYIAEVIGEKRLEVIDKIAAEDMFDRGQPRPGRDGLWKHVRDSYQGAKSTRCVIVRYPL